MRIIIELRRPSRRAVLALAALLALLPGVALASHQFPDVPNANPFHDNISAIAKAGITAGFGDGTYRPADPVTRQAMAAFMHRGFGRVAFVSNVAPESGIVPVAMGSSQSDTPALVRSLTITVPGASNDTNPNQLVHVRGHVVFQAVMNSGAPGCPCEFTAWIRDQGTLITNDYQSEMFHTASGITYQWSVDVETVFEAPPGPRTYELFVQLTFREDNGSAASFALDSRSTMTAMTFPFGPTGGSDI